MSYKTALITGASRGIGRAIALSMASAGYHLMLTCHRNQDMLTELAHQIESRYPVTCLTYAGDMGDYEAVQKMYACFQQRFASLDVIVNNAGISHMGLLTDMNPEEWDRIMATNLSSVFYTCRYGIPIMLRKRPERSSISPLCGEWPALPVKLPTLPPREVSTRSPKHWQRSLVPATSRSMPSPAEPLIRR